MRHYGFLIGIFAVLGLGICRVQAQYPYANTGHRPVSRAVHHMAAEWKRNNAWPQPYIFQDRQAVRAPFAIMVAKGWQLQNTLGDHHFDVETQELTRAGELHLKWIMQQSPEQYRTVFVLRGHNEAATSVRIDTVQQAVAQLQPRGPLPEVVQTNLAPPTSPAEYADSINQKAVNSRPDPVLPAATGGSGGGAAAASGT